MNKKSLFLFRRDLRLEDNLGLIQALMNSETVIPCFIYDKNLLKNKNIGDFRWNFLNQCLEDLDLELKSKKSQLQIFTGSPSKVVEDFISNHQINSVFCNIDFSEYAKKRDKKISDVCKRKGVQFNMFLDFLLHNPNEIKTNENSPYLVYSHFLKKARQYPIRKVLKNNLINYYRDSISDQKIQQSTKTNTEFHGGRKEGLKILKNLEKFRDYSKIRDFPNLGTTKISAHNKFGTISIREFFNTVIDTLGISHELIRQIYWREFFNYVLYH